MREYLDRTTNGEFWTLFKELIDELKFSHCFRMYRYKFCNLHRNVQVDLLKKNITLGETVVACCATCYCNSLCCLTDSVNYSSDDMQFSND